MKILKNISIAAFLVSFAAFGISLCVTVANAVAYFFQSDLPWYVKLLVASLLSCFIFSGLSVKGEETIDFDSKTGKFNINKYEQR